MKMPNLKTLLFLLFCCFSVTLSSPFFPSRRSNRIENLFTISEEEERVFNEEALQETIAEKIKIRLLNALNLTDIPKSSFTKPPLQTFREKHRLFISSVAEEEEGDSKKIQALYSEPAPNTCFHQTKGLRCYRMEIDLSAIPSGKLASSSYDLWLYKRKGITSFKIAQYLEEPGVPELKKNIFYVIDQDWEAGWLRFNASLFVQIAASKLDLEIYAKDQVPIEDGKDKKPFLLRKELFVAENRLKRSTSRDCLGNDDLCCKQELYVLFSEVPWGEFIVEPKGYYANMCRGSCHNRLDLASTNHAQVLLGLMARPGNHTDLDIKLSCNPKEYDELSVLYKNSDGLKLANHLSKMTVTECACF